MALDIDELFRVEADGTAAYPPRDILLGDVVLSDAEIGYWDTRLSRSYPNPLLVKLVRSMWEHHPNFTVFGDCHWGRGGSVARSGVVPHVSSCTDAPKYPCLCGTDSRCDVLYFVISSVL